MNQELQVVQGKLFDVVPEMVLLVHALQKSQGSGSHLREKKNPKKGKINDIFFQKHYPREFQGEDAYTTFSFSWELRSRSTCRY